MIIANAKSFASLNAAQQNALRQIVDEEGDTISAEFIKDEDVQMGLQAGKGMKIAQTTKNEIDAATKKLQPYWENWARQNGAEYESALKLVRTAVGK